MTGPGRMPVMPRRSWTMALLVAAVFIATMDIFIVNVALPNIQHGVDASNGELQLVVAVYSLSYGVLIITSSRLGDRHGRKTLFLLGVALFTASSLACGLATSASGLIAARALQGVGAAAMVPQVLPTIHVLFPPEHRQRALGLYGAAIGLGAMVGQLCGGTLIATDLFGLGWRLVFLVNVPIGLAVVAIGLRVIGDSHDARPRRLDLAGVAVLTAALVCFMLPLVASSGAHWEPWMITALAAAVFAGVAFARVERSVTRSGGDPLVHAALFRSPAYAPAVVALALAQGSLAAFILVYTLHMQLGMTFSPLAVGASLGVPAIGYTLASLATGELVRRWGGRVPVAGSCLVVAGYGAILVLAAVERDDLELHAALAPLVASSVGRGLMVTPTIHAAFRRVKPEHLGMASGVLNTSFQLGNLVGTGVLGSVFFAVRHVASGPLPQRSTAAFIASTAAIVAIAVLSLAGVWRAQRIATSS
jgi:MFS family permease